MIVAAMILVFGSVNIDLVFNVPSLPGPGQTVLGPDYAVVPGGKGANQALAAARDGTKVAMVGRVGRDAFAKLALGSLIDGGVDVSGVAVDDAPTGCAVIGVDRTGENQIMVASGANACVTADQVPDALLGPRTTLVLQMEVPEAANAALIGRARRRGARIVLNLAPAAALPDEALRAVDVLAVNAGEAAWLGRHAGIAQADGAALAQRLAARLGVMVVATFGGEGAVAAAGDALWSIGALPVAAIDTTGAGDAFVGVLAAALDAGETIEHALRRASVAAGLACEGRGAQPSLPSRRAIGGALERLAPATRFVT